MIKPLLSLLLIILSLFGIADASYLTYEKLSGHVPVCGPGFDCGTVINSEWANIGPVPISALGLFFYSTVFVFSLLHYLEKDLSFLNKILRFPYNFKPLNYLQVLVTFGGLFTIYLITIMGVVLQAWCQYCLYSAVISGLLFAIVFSYTHFVEKKQPSMLKWLWYRFVYIVYQVLAKPLFFLFDPEVIHEFISDVGHLMGRIKGFPGITGRFFSYPDPQLNRNLAGINFPNPVGLSAGYDYDGKLTQILPGIGFGFQTIGTVTYRPYQGNPRPAYVRLKKSQSLIVNKGLKNSGVAQIISDLENLEFKIPIGISIGSTNTFYKSTKDQILDIAKAFKLFEKSRVKHQYYEINISCPNTFGGEPFAKPERLETLLTVLDSLNLTRPLFIKMPIDQGRAETESLLITADKHKVAGVIFGNLSKNRNNPALTAEDRAVWKNNKGNVSGKPTWKLSNEHIKLTKKLYKNRFVIIGTGGIFTPEDAAYKLSIGADLVQLVTGLIFSGPQLIGDINHHLSESQNS